MDKILKEEIIEILREIKHEGFESFVGGTCSGCDEELEVFELDYGTNFIARIDMALFKLEKQS